MTVSIMQPYLLPYVGYFQLIAASDTFVSLDDVNFIQRGWINRNRLLSPSGEDQMVTLSLSGASQNSLIKDIEIFSPNESKQKLTNSIANAYRRAPGFKIWMPRFEEILLNPERNLAKYLQKSLFTICGHLNLNRKFLVSSELPKAADRKAQDRIIEICKVTGANHYVNPSGGKELYTAEDFQNQGLRLSFLKGQLEPYKQFEHPFVPGLSIVDVCMFNDDDQLQKRLQEYSLVPN